MEAIRGAEHVIAIFGSWPSFHDAEVLRVGLSREPAGPDEMPPFLELDIHTFDTDGSLTPDGYYRLTNQVVVSFRFQGVEALVLEDFGRQNVLAELIVTPTRNSEGRDVLIVELPSILGLGGTFQCTVAEVVAVRPWIDTRAKRPEPRDA